MDDLEKIQEQIKKLEEELGKSDPMFKLILFALLVLGWNNDNEMEV